MGRTVHKPKKNKQEYMNRQTDAKDKDRTEREINSELYRAALIRSFESANTRAAAQRTVKRTKTKRVQVQHGSEDLDGRICADQIAFTLTRPRPLDADYTSSGEFQIRNTNSRRDRLYISSLAVPPSPYRCLPSILYSLN